MRKKFFWPLNYSLSPILAIKHQNWIYLIINVSKTENLIHRTFVFIPLTAACIRLPIVRLSTMNDRTEYDDGCPAFFGCATGHGRPHIALGDDSNQPMPLRVSIRSELADRTGRSNSRAADSTIKAGTMAWKLESDG